MKAVKLNSIELLRNIVHYGAWEERWSIYWEYNIKYIKF